MTRPRRLNVVSLLIIAPFCITWVHFHLIGNWGVRAETATAPSLGTSLDQVEFQGLATLDRSSGGASVRARHEYRVEDRLHHAVLSIAPADAVNTFAPHSFEPETGQQFLTALYSTRFGSLGDLICAEWDYGASTRKFTVFRLGQNGKIQVVFDQGSRFGFRVLDVGGRTIPNICGAYGNIGGPYKMKAFGWKGDRFELSKTIDVAEPHVYAIKQGKRVDNSVNVAQ